MPDRLPTIGPKWWIAFGQWLADKRWAENAMRARRWRRPLTTAQQEIFDAALRPNCSPDEWIMGVVPYPDAFYEITIDDLCRAMIASRLGRL
jgi:hypothetical protein